MRYLHPYRLLWVFALVAAVTPLWFAKTLPMVDLPQHLHLISVMLRLDDGSTLYPETFALRPGPTPYLGYYHLVALLARAMPLELANRLFLSAVTAALPLSLALLLSALRRPTWPALLAVPFAYGSNFATGFVSYLASVPLAVLTCALMVRTLQASPERRWRPAVGLAVSLLAVLLFHVQMFAWLALALPLLMVTTPAPAGHAVRARLAALAGVLPGVALALVWFGRRLGAPMEIAADQPWKARGAMLARENLVFHSFARNLTDLFHRAAGQRGGPRFRLFAGMRRDALDDVGVLLAFGLFAAAVVVHLVLLSRRNRAVETESETWWPMPALAGFAALLYFTLPCDIHGYMYTINSRYAAPLAALLVASAPMLPGRWAAGFSVAAAIVAVVTATTLAPAFRAFDAEARALDEIAAASGDRPRIMGLIYDTASETIPYALHVHAAATVARARGGVTNFSFAGTPHNPVQYRAAAPPTFPSEWAPAAMNWTEHGRHYDHFLLRGGPAPEEIFGPLLGTELDVAARADGFTLIRRR